MLGGDQLAWLEQQLETAQSAPLVVLVNTVPWITKRKESTGDGWARYARERRRVADLMRFGLTERLVMLSGDQHMLAWTMARTASYRRCQSARRGFVHGPCTPNGSTAKPGKVDPIRIPKCNRHFGMLNVTDDRSSGDVDSAWAARKRLGWRWR